jgi:hypothetical protein
VLERRACQQIADFAAAARGLLYAPIGARRCAPWSETSGDLVDAEPNSPQCGGTGALCGGQEHAIH